MERYPQPAGNRRRGDSQRNLKVIAAKTGAEGKWRKAVRVEPYKCLGYQCSMLGFIGFAVLSCCLCSLLLGYVFDTFSTLFFDENASGVDGGCAGVVVVASQALLVSYVAAYVD